MKSILTLLLGLFMLSSIPRAVTASENSCEKAKLELASSEVELQVVVAPESYTTIVASPSFTELRASVLAVNSTSNKESGSQDNERLCLSKYAITSTKSSKYKYKLPVTYVRFMYNHYGNVQFARSGIPWSPTSVL